MTLGTALFVAWLGLCPPPQIGRLVMPPQVWQWTLEAAEATRTNPYHLAGIMAIESRFDLQASSEEGLCFGLMQLHRDTAKRLGINRYDPRQNILGGAMVWARLMKKYQGNMRLAARGYNGKPDTAAYEREVLRAIAQAQAQGR